LPRTPSAPDFAAEAAHLRLAVARAMALGATLVACGGQTQGIPSQGDAGNPGMDSGQPLADSGQPAVDTGIPCYEQEWSFPCADVDAGAADAGADLSSPPACSLFAPSSPAQFGGLCAMYCYGPMATNPCNNQSSSANAQYTGCLAETNLEDGGPLLKVNCSLDLPGGRRHATYEPPAHDRVVAVGEWLARLAHLEAASVDAFRILCDDLMTHGAPAHLVAAAERSIADEMRHADLVGSFAGVHGGEVAAPAPARRTARTLFEVARENAVEGCVRETFGALVAMWQARTAKNAAFADAMRAIAEDEARHAALAWHIAAWAETQLTPEENARVREAAAAAEAELRAEMDALAETDASRWLGLPSPREARRLWAEHLAAA
jgi:hypothetical protein